MASAKCAAMKVPFSIQLTGNDVNHNVGLPEMITDKEKVVKDLSGFDFEDQVGNGVDKAKEDIDSNEL